MSASEAAVKATMEVLDCQRAVDRNGHAYCEAHWYGWLSDTDACPRAERAANAAVDADRASIQAVTLRAASNDIQALHPGETKNSVIWLRERATAIEARR